MTPWTRWFGVTTDAAQRDATREAADIMEIAERSVRMQSMAAKAQHRGLLRGTHAKGICARAEFEVFDLAAGKDPALAARLTRGIFAKPGVYPAVVRFGNSDSKVNRDLKADVRSLSFSVDLSRGDSVDVGLGTQRQDFSLQNASTLPINDQPAFVAVTKLLTASSQAAGLWGLPWRDKLRVIRTLVLVQLQSHQKRLPYQRLRYWSTVPFAHGPDEAVKYCATPGLAITERRLQDNNANALRDELIRHLAEDTPLASFEFAVQLLDASRMTYWGQPQDTSFWLENASVEWKESEAPFHPVGRLTLLPRSQLSAAQGEAVYFDVTGHAAPDSKPLGSINRARSMGEAASRRARMRATSSP